MNQLRNELVHSQAELTVGLVRPSEIVRTLNGDGTVTLRAGVNNQEVVVTAHPDGQPEHAIIHVNGRRSEGEHAHRIHKLIEARAGEKDPSAPHSGSDPVCFSHPIVERWRRRFGLDAE